LAHPGGDRGAQAQALGDGGRVEADAAVDRRHPGGAVRGAGDGHVGASGAGVAQDVVEGLGEGGAEGRRDVGGQAGERFQAVVLGGDAQAQAFRRVDRPFDGGRRGRGRGAVRGRSPRAAGGGFLVGLLLYQAAEVGGLPGAAFAYRECGGVGAAGGDGGEGGEDRVVQRPGVGEAFGVACPCRPGGDGRGGGGGEPAARRAQVPPEEAGQDGRGDDRVEVGDDDGDVRVGQPVAGRVRREEG